MVGEENTVVQPDKDVVAVVVPSKDPEDTTGGSQGKLGRVKAQNGSMRWEVLANLAGGKPLIGCRVRVNQEDSLRARVYEWQIA